jgi:hypothetical protein
MPTGRDDQRHSPCAVEAGQRAERDRKLQWLRDKLNRSIDAGGEVSDAELDAALDAQAEELRRQGF